MAVRLIKRGGRWILSRRGQKVPFGGASTPTVRRYGAGRVSQNPQQYYSTLLKSDLASQRSANFFVTQPDAEEIYGNYSKPYIERAARITGIKLDILPETFEEKVGTDNYIANINKILQGTVSLIVNKYPVFDWKVDDIGSVPGIDVYDDGTDEFVVVSLHAPLFTTFRDLVESKMVETKGIDNIYVHLELIDTLDAAADFPDSLAVKTTLLIRPEIGLPGIVRNIGPGVRPVIPTPGIRPRPRPTAPRGAIAGSVDAITPGKMPYVFYSLLKPDDILTVYDGRTIEFFALRPDANRLYGNYDEEKIHRRMSIQGLKLGFYPYINSASKSASYPTGEYAYCINALKNATFELIVNKNPVFTFKGAELFGEVVTRAVKAGGAATSYYTVKRLEKFLIFKDLISKKELDVTEDDDVWVRCRFASTLQAADIPTDPKFIVKMSMLVAAVPKPIRL